MLNADRAAKKEESSQVCSNCGLAIAGSSARGSLTSWIFRARCKCDTGGTGIALKQDPESLTKVELVVHHDSPDEVALGEDFEVLSELGSGGMASVYKVLDKRVQKVFAIKVLHSKLCDDPATVKRFQQEAKAASGLTHPNLVPVYGQGVSKQGAPFLVMDYLEGQSLAELLKKEVFLDSKRANDIFIQIAEAVGHAHSKGIVHRDLKPSNIILIHTDEGLDLVKVVDFGIAKVIAPLASESQQLTNTGEIFGSPLFMSPEQCAGRTVDVRSDIYSLGCLMYNTLCGSPPFVGKNPVETILQHLHQPAADLRRGHSSLNIPVALAAVVHRCLEKAPEDRYQTMVELEADLNAVRDGRPIQRYKRKVRRKKPPLFAGAAALLSVAMVAYVITVQYHQATVPAALQWHNLNAAAQRAFDAGRYDEAERLLNSALSVAKGAHAQGLVKTNLEDLADLQQAKGNTQGAQAVRMQIANLASTEALPSADDLVHQLRSVLSELEQHKATQSTDHFLKLCHDANDSAVLLNQAGHFGQAREILELVSKVLALCPKIDGTIEARTLYNIGNTAERQGQFAEAEKYYVRAVESFNRHGERFNPSLSKALIALARMRLARGNADGVEEMCRQSLQICRSTFGPQSAQMAEERLEQAEVLISQKRVAEARKMLVEASSYYQGADAPADQKAKWHFLVGALSQNAPELRSALELYEDNVPREYIHMAYALFDLGSAVSTTEAGPLYKRALVISSRLPSQQELTRKIQAAIDPDH